MTDDADRAVGSPRERAGLPGQWTGSVMLSNMHPASTSRTIAVFRALPGTFHYWATERYCLDAFSARHGISRVEVHHGLWPLQPAEVMVGARSSPRPGSPPWRGRSSLVVRRASLPGRLRGNPRRRRRCIAISDTCGGRRRVFAGARRGKIGALLPSSPHGGHGNEPLSCRSVIWDNGRGGPAVPARVAAPQARITPVRFHPIHPTTASNLTISS